MYFKAKNNSPDPVPLSWIVIWWPIPISIMFQFQPSKIEFVWVCKKYYIIVHFGDHYHSLVPNICFYDIIYTRDVLNDSKYFLKHISKEFYIISWYESEINIRTESTVFWSIKLISTWSTYRWTWRYPDFSMNIGGADLLKSFNLNQRR